MIRPFVSVIIVLSSMIFNLAVAAQPNIVKPYIRALPPGVPNSAAFLVIENPMSESVVLLGAETEIAARAELHNHLSEDGVMKMRQVDSIEVPAKSKVTLQPGGLHIMLFDIKNSPQVGQQIPITLIFADDTKITVMAEVRDLREQHHHHEHH
ncbi:MULTISPECIES: copper chaperone PCu(A)C [Corallincola]|uniref:Copper chaperone PCu(A)C n=2 Tax=Corallincola TaxID=1775176 RepID=A0ABY1WRC8_9GAMM|nr:MULTISPECIES: copper chaperone PCu(A)C [Corallincola]TAA47089.1 copper chaperone PCu(A)C [Corallincola spongiicola]TCI04740.1 copper chaperone PCu(A)C [Corallincola luteus]